MTPTIALDIAHPARSRAALFLTVAAQSTRRPRCRSLLVRGFPDPLLYEVEQRGEHQEEDQDPEANSLTLWKIRFGCPAQKGCNVLGVIVQGRLGAILIIDRAVGDGLRHRDLVAGIVQIPL